MSEPLPLLTRLSLLSRMFDTTFANLARPSFAELLDLAKDPSNEGMLRDAALREATAEIDGSPPKTTTRGRFGDWMFAVDVNTTCGVIWIWHSNGGRTVVVEWSDDDGGTFRVSDFVRAATKSTQPFESLAGALEAAIVALRAPRELLQILDQMPRLITIEASIG